MTKRKNKSKKDIVSDIQLVQDTKRVRSLVRDIVFPYLCELDENVAYSKVFLQSFSGLIEGVFDDQRNVTTIAHMTPKIMEKLKSIFVLKDPAQKREYDRYCTLIEKVRDVSVKDLSRATELPRFIDGFNTQKKDKEPIKNIPIDEILG